jgi:acyl-CoA thioester hydrolase
MGEDDHSITIGVRYRDFDTMNHVNNSVYVTYLEQARAEYFSDVIGVPLDEANIVLATLTIEYKKPIEPDEMITVTTRILNLGKSSIPMEHEIHTESDLAATSSTVIVPFDHETESPRPIPATWRDRIRRYEQHDTDT